MEQFDRRSRILLADLRRRDDNQSAIVQLDFCVAIRTQQPESESHGGKRARQETRAFALADGEGRIVLDLSHARLAFSIQRRPYEKSVAVN